MNKVLIGLFLSVFISVPVMAMNGPFECDIKEKSRGIFAGGISVFVTFDPAQALVLTIAGSYGFKCTDGDKDSMVCESTEEPFSKLGPIILSYNSRLSQLQEDQNNETFLCKKVRPEDVQAIQDDGSSYPLKFESDWHFSNF